MRYRDIKHLAALSTVQDREEAQRSFKRGPKSNPFREKCEHGWHVHLTKCESDAWPRS